ncbi:calmodulin [Dunaliella salina]|uniref:Calmodulin n=1 Tax=Dunaliella salina TaxID=3046 RepID=A0ABQ7FWM4_DUNSA|nr:calmodulin [Dunaliella salina]|eukprot:KAF5826736.1 calmodulin [Dunaliella salina]
MAIQMTEDQKTDLQEAFDIFDKNGDGKIDAKELGFVIRTIGQNATETELGVMIKEVDADGDNEINMSECLMIMARYIKERNVEEELRQAFKVFDHTQNNYIPVEEFRRMMTNMGEKLSDQEVEEMLRDAPVDKDGRLYYNEFIKLMLTKNEVNEAQSQVTL